MGIFAGVVAAAVALIAFGIYMRRAKKRVVETEAAAAQINEAERTNPTTHEPVPHVHGRGAGREAWPEGPQSRLAHVTIAHGAREQAMVAWTMLDEQDYDWDMPLRTLHRSLHGLADGDRTEPEPS